MCVFITLGAAANTHCLVLADGFYEFREFDGKKYPYFIRISNGRPFAMADIPEANRTGQRKKHS